MVKQPIIIYLILLNPINIFPDIEKREWLLPSEKDVKLKKTKHNFIVVTSYLCAIGTTDTLPNSCMFSARESKFILMFSTH